MAPLSSTNPSQVSAGPILYTFPTKDALSMSLAEFVIKAQDEAIERRDKFSVATSGGSLPSMLAKFLIDRPDDPALRWDKWEIWFSDERLVPLDDKESNFWLCNEEFFSKVPLKREQIHTINTQYLNDAEEVANQYEKEMVQAFADKQTVRVPALDLILLGMGPDGHTASLFPGHELLNETDRWIAPIVDSPKPPARRITFTYPVLNHAHRVAFVLAGEGKQDLLATVLDHPEQGIPASRVRPVPPGDLFFFTDEAASAKTQYAPADFKI